MHAFRFLIIMIVIAGAGWLRAQVPADVEARVTAALSRMTLEEKIDLLGGVDSFYLRAVPAAGLPRLRMADGPMGVRNDGPSTAVGGIALAATWDTELAESVGAQIGRDARARGVHFVLGPGVNIYVAPMNGRNFEYLGEDPFLSGRMATAWINGVQKQGVSATVKHFLGNNSEFNRHNVDAVIDERALHEIYLPAFEAAVKQGHAGAIMDSYNLVNGQHLTQNPRLNNDVVKKAWKFDGLIMSDWYATYDGVAAANGGMDLEMPSGAFMNRKSLLPAIDAGRVTVATIDDKVRRVLRLAARFGWMDREQTDLTISRANPEGRDVALRTAQEGMVLLKNEDGVLPVNLDAIKSIAVIGPNAYPAVPVGGGSAGVKPFAAVSFLEGLSSALGKRANVLYHRGIPDWAKLANSTFFSVDERGAQPGIKVELFGGKDFAGSPLFTETMEHIFTTPGSSTVQAPPEGTAARWTGFYTAKTAGTYQLFAQTPMDSGGGFRLLVDGKAVIDGWTVRKSVIDQASVALTAGAHKVVFERFREGRNFLGDLVRVGIAPNGSFVDADAKAMAAKADLVVLAVGYDNESETEGGDRTFGLPTGQDELIREIAAVNRKTVVVVTSGGGVDMSGWVDRVPGVIQAWYPGQEGGTALAGILLGDVNPSGRLPATFEKQWADNPSHDSYYPDAGTTRVVYRSGVFVGYRGYEHNGKQPLFPFGFGLSYTSFRYSDLAIKPLGSAGRYDVSFSVTNTGARPGAEVPQIYVGDGHASVPRPPKELKGFARVMLAPGETKTVHVSLDERSFTYFDTAGSQWRADAGDFDVLVARSSARIELRGKVTLAAIQLPAE
jgi:beta-glucosidase